jgi:hypothetical protein
MLMRLPFLTTRLVLAGALIAASLGPVVALAATPACSIAVVPSTIAPGESTRLSWTMNNAIVGVFSGGKTVTASGSDTVKPTESRSYTLVVKDDSGAQTTCATQVIVRSAMPSCTIAVNPAQIVRGNSASISWRSKDALGANIPGIGTVDPNDSYIVSPSVTTQYRMTVQNSSGTASCATTLSVVNSNNSVAAPQIRQQGSVAQPRPLTVVSPSYQLVNSTPVIIVDDPWYSWLEPVWAVPEFVYDEVFLPVWEPIESYFGYLDEEYDDSYVRSDSDGSNYQDPYDNDQGGTYRTTETADGTYVTEGDFNSNDQGGVFTPNSLRVPQYQNSDDNDQGTPGAPWGEEGGSYDALPEGAQYQDPNDNDQGTVDSAEVRTYDI